MKNSAIDKTKTDVLMLKLRNLFIYHLFFSPLYIMFFPSIFEKLQQFVFSKGSDSIIVSQYFAKKISGLFLFLFILSFAFIASSIFGIIHKNLVSDHSFKKPLKIISLIIYITVTFMFLPLSFFNFTSITKDGIFYSNGMLFTQKQYEFSDIKRMFMSRYVVIRSFVPVYEAWFSDGRKLNLMCDVPDQKIFNFTEKLIPQKIERSADSISIDYYLRAFDDDAGKRFMAGYIIAD